MIIKQLTLGTILIGWLVLFCGCNSEKNEQTLKNKGEIPIKASLMNAKKIAIDKTSLIDFGNKKKAINHIISNNKDSKIKDVTISKPTISNASQQKVDFSICKLKMTEIPQTKTIKNREVYAILSLCYTLKNNSDEEISIHPKTAALILANGNQIDGNDFIYYWEDVFKKGKRKDSSFHFNFIDMKQIKQVRALKFIFTGYVKENQKATFEREYAFEFPLDLN